MLVLVLTTENALVIHDVERVLCRIEIADHNPAHLQRVRLALDALRGVVIDRVDRIDRPASQEVR